MILRLLTIFAILGCSIIGVAQEKKRTERDVIKDKRLYLDYNIGKNEFSYYTTAIGPSGDAVMDNGDVFSLKGDNSCNLFFKWLNPFKYQVSFKDTTVVSPNDEAITSFFKNNFMAILGDASKVTKGDGTLSVEGVHTIPKKTATAVIASTAIADTKAYRSEKLNLLALQYGSQYIENSDTLAVKNLFAALRQLDDAADYNFFGTTKSSIEKLIKLTDYNKVADTLEEVEGLIGNMNLKLNYLKSTQKPFDPFNYSISNEWLASYTISVVSGFLAEAKLKEEAAAVLIKQGNAAVAIMKKSIANAEDPDQKGYFKLKNVKFPDGRDFESQIIVHKYEYNFEKFELAKKDVALKVDVTFERHDWIRISAGSGLFYSDITRKGFGVAESNGGLVVATDDVDDKTGGAAAYLNVNFDIGSRSWNPLIQIGADPTKKRPFLMLGGGFAFLRDKFAVTYGRIFTWTPVLDKLSVGGPVASTVELEKDIKYKFDFKTQGWYLGIQYNF